MQIVSCISEFFLMAKSKQPTQPTALSGSKNAEKSVIFFGKENFILMALGLLFIFIGFFLMSGGKSADPKKFDPKEIYSTVRITIAPIMIILGFLIEIVAIMKKPKTDTK